MSKYRIFSIFPIFSSPLLDLLPKFPQVRRPKSTTISEITPQTVANYSDTPIPCYRKYFFENKFYYWKKQDDYYFPIKNEF